MGNYTMCSRGFKPLELRGGVQAHKQCAVTDRDVSWVLHDWYVLKC